MTAVLGGVLALMIAVIVGEGDEMDGFLAAYSVYLTFILFGSTMRVALVPLLGSTSDEAAFTRRAADRVRRLLGAAAVMSLVLAAASPLLGKVLVPSASSHAQTTAAMSVAILAVAAYCQIWSASLSAVLGAGRRFMSSGLLYVLGSTTALVLSIGLMELIGIAGAAIGVLGGALALLAAHLVYLHRFGFDVLPGWRLAREAATWKLTAKTAAGAAIPMALQLNVTISLALISGKTGAVTAYSYAYFFTVLLSSVTSAAIGLVTMPALVAQLHEHGKGVAVDYVKTVVPFSVFLFVPLAVAYALFARPIVDAVLGGSLTPATVDLLWDASRVFLLMGIAWAVLAPMTTLALSLQMFGGVAAIAALVVPVHLALVVPASAVGPVTVAAAHALAGTILVVMVLVLIFRRRAPAVALVAIRRSLPAAALALVFPALRLVGVDDDTVVQAFIGLVTGGVLYVLLGVMLWPSVGRQSVRLLFSRA